MMGLLSCLASVGSRKENDMLYINGFLAPLLGLLTIASRAGAFVGPGALLQRPCSRAKLDGGRRRSVGASR